MKLVDYYSEQTSLNEDIEELVDIDENKRIEINILVLNIVLKYLTSYLKIKETSIDIIKSKVHKIVETEMNSFSNLSNQQTRIKIFEQFGLNCLLDIRQTSAIFKEISLDEKYDITDTFRGLDLGSGSGILTLAMYISGLRSGVKEGSICFIDQSKKLINNSTDIFNKLGGQYNFSGRVGDILNINTYKNLDLDNLSYLVSETIGHTTPSFSINPNNGDLIGLTKASKIMLQILSQEDPYASVLSTIISLSPSLYESIEDLKTGMFPNLLNKSFIPNNEESKLLLKTGVSGKLKLLEFAGEEFNKFEDFGIDKRRWPTMDEEDSFY